LFVTILLLVTLIGVGHFADFLLGSAGQRRIKDRIVNLYVVASEEGWNSIIRFSSRLFRKYLEHTFGPKSFSLRYILSVALYSTIMLFLVNVLHLGDINIPRLALSFCVIFLFDIVSIRLVIRLLRRQELRTESSSSSRLASDIFLFIVFGASVFFITNIYINTAYLVVKEFIPSQCSSLAAGSHLNSWSCFPSTERLEYQEERIKRNLVFRILPLKDEGNNYYILLGEKVRVPHTIFEIDRFRTRNVILVSLQIYLPMITYLLIFGTLTLIYFSEDTLRPGFLLFLERVEETKSGVFTLLAFAINGLVGVLTALSKLLGS
jgi:hypothetical protein